VIAPEPTAGGQVVARLSDRYSPVAHLYVAGAPAGEDGQFASDEDWYPIPVSLMLDEAADWITLHNRCSARLSQ